MDDIVLRLDELLRSVADLPAAAPSIQAVALEMGRAARWEWEARRNRERLFGSALFSDTAWDILLYLFVARAEGRDVTVPDICETTKLAEPAMLRCLAMLIEAGLVVRESQSSAPRGNHLTLSEQAVGLMCDYFSRTKTGLGAGVA